MTRLPWTLAWARLRNHVLRTLSIALSATLAVVALLALQGISHSTGNSLVTYSLSKLPAGDRTLTLTSNRIISSANQSRSIYTYLSRQLSELASGPITPEVLYHEISDLHGQGFYFAGVDSLASSVHLISGRLPEQCTPTLCEVLQIGGPRNSTPAVDRLGLKIVGDGKFFNSQLFTGTMAPSDTSPILVADGIAAASNLPAFANLQGADGWVAMMDLAKIGTHGADAYISSMLIFNNRLSIDHPEVSLTWPQDALGEASDQSKAISDKFVLLDYVVGALLIAFLILFSLRHRREHHQFRAGLSRIGTPKGTLVLELLIENMAPLILGAFLAFLVSLAIPSALSVAHFHASLLEIYQSWPKYPYLVLAGLGLVIGSMIVGDRAWGRQFLAPYVFAAIFLCAFLQQTHTKDMRFWLIPFAYTLIPGLIGYFALRTASSLWRNRKHETFVLFREHLSMWQGVTAILTLAGILAVIALSFDSGISREVTAKARDDVPLDVSLKVGPSLVRPLDLGGTRAYEDLVPGSKAYAILRSGTAVRNESSVSDSLSIIGLPPEVLRQMSDKSLHGFASAISQSQPPFEQGISIAATREIVVTLENIPKEVDLLAWFRTPNGTHISATFTGHDQTRTLITDGQIPSESSLIAFEFRETSDYLSRRLHAMGEGSFSVPMLKGTGSITKVDFDGRSQILTPGIWHQMNFPYEFNGGSLYIRPAIKPNIPKAVVDPLSASLATNGLLTLTGASGDYFQVRVAAISKNFPSAGDRFVVMDLQQLQNEIAQSDLGATDPIEIWISTPKPHQYLEKVANSPFKALFSLSQQNVARELRADPVNVGLNGAYKVALFYALLLALFMYATALPLLYREGKDVLFQLEAGGISPRNLRGALLASLRLATSMALLLGGLIGLIVGHFFISQSTPYTVVILSLMAAMALSEIGSFALTRRFFGENAMVRSRK